MAYGQSAPRRRHWLTRLLFWVGVAWTLYFIATQPTDAARLAERVFDAFAAVGHGLIIIAERVVT